MSLAVFDPTSVPVPVSPPAAARLDFSSWLLVVAAAGLAAASPPVSAQAAVEKVTVRAVAHFDFDRAVLREADQQALLADVAKLGDVSWQLVTATGHTDATGPLAYNQRLAKRRADAVRGYLLSKGLDPAMVRSQALGPSSPVASNDEAAGRARNRRAEVQFEGVRSVASR